MSKIFWIKFTAAFLLFAIGFPLAVVASIFNIVGFVLGSISDIFHSMFVRIYRPDDK